MRSEVERKYQGLLESIGKERRTANANGTAEGQLTGPCSSSVPVLHWIVDYYFRALLCTVCVLSRCTPSVPTILFPVSLLLRRMSTTTEQLRIHCLSVCLLAGDDDGDGNGWRWRRRRGSRKLNAPAERKPPIPTRPSTRRFFPAIPQLAIFARIGSHDRLQRRGEGSKETDAAAQPPPCSRSAATNPAERNEHPPHRSSQMTGRERTKIYVRWLPISAQGTRSSDFRAFSFALIHPSIHPSIISINPHPSPSIPHPSPSIPIHPSSSLPSFPSMI
ncbi:hypothetical protein FN846DRAFT_38630 [Sphaerosporella brunnea]|uniref:Uncharacterized protein n=1 Tax=Sphaerosporella brunnea TaxID=1250544 RepID=A0A5J5FA31_9PEZI|nr:hypothetical protein FN846DRAFT_38630 [Sphaerosporella brunnea]